MSTKNRGRGRCFPSKLSCSFLGQRCRGILAGLPPGPRQYSWSSATEPGALLRTKLRNRLTRLSPAKLVVLSSATDDSLGHDARPDTCCEDHGPNGRRNLSHSSITRSKCSVFTAKATLREYCFDGCFASSIGLNVLGVFTLEKGEF